MDSIVHITPEIAAGQIGVILTILGTGISIYLKSRLDVQRLTMSYEAVFTKMSTLEQKVDSLVIKQHDLTVKLEVLAATTGYGANLSQIMTRLAAAGAKHVEDAKHG